MTVKEILLLGDEFLRKKSRKVFLSEINAEEINDLRDTLIDFTEKNGLGRGIAAPQIGLLKRMIYIISDEFEGILINPEITLKSNEIFFVWDSCFSLKAEIFCRVKRNKKITVSFFDEKGKQKSINAEDSFSELLQHEIDHLDGIMCTDRIESAKDLILREEWEKRGKPFLAG
ncbi:MAG: peptide deformylase [Candidatus Diapherotrites archaeon]